VFLIYAERINPIEHNYLTSTCISSNENVFDLCLADSTISSLFLVSFCDEVNSLCVYICPGLT
jgi:hypothetical protein